MSEADVQRTLGELTAAVRAIRDAINENRDARKGEMDRLENTIREAKHEQRNATQGLRGGLELIDRRVRVIEIALPQLTLDIKNLSSDVAHVKGPVDELVSYRQRIGAMVFVLMGALTLVGTMVGPLITSGVGKMFGLLTHG